MIPTIAFLGAALAAAPAQEEARRLEAARLSVRFEGVRLDRALRTLGDAAGVAIDPPDLTGQPPVTLTMNGVSVRSLLKRILHPRGLTATVRGGRVIVVRQAELRRFETRIYDVRDLLVRILDFEFREGPGLRSGAPPVLKGAVFNPVDATECACPVESWLVDLVRGETDGEDDEASLNLVDGRLVVGQVPAVHDRIRALLAKLRRNVLYR